MKTILPLKIRGYYVHGIDRKDNGSFEDFIVIETPNLGTAGIERKITEMYAECGYEATDVTFECEFKVEIDLFREYLKAKEAQKESATAGNRNGLYVENLYR